MFNLGIWKGREQKKVKKNIKQCLACSRKIFWTEFLFPTFHSLSLSLTLVILLPLFFTDLTVSGLGMVHVTIPNAIQSGRNVIMTCDYELENDDLYSVKWYKGKREFFRYTPKEIPSIKIFKLPGIRVDVSWCFADSTPTFLLLIIYSVHTLLFSYNIFIEGKEKLGAGK